MVCGAAETALSASGSVLRCLFRRSLFQLVASRAARPVSDLYFVDYLARTWIRTHEFDKVARIALLVMIVTQILWSGYALFYDHYYAYSPDAAAAEFLKPFVNEDATIAVTYAKGDSFWNGNAYPSVGIEPYFDHNIYVNTTHPFWWWSDQDQSEDRFKDVLPFHPRFVVVELVALHPLSAISLIAQCS